MTFESWLHRWLEVYKIPYLKSSSIARINVSIRNHIPSWIKKMSLDRLTAFDVDRAISFCKLPRSRESIIDEQLKNAVSDYVFPYKGDTLTHWFKVFCPGHKLHDLRHTFITLCAESGVNINVTQNLVGHKTLNTTLAIYTHISLDFVRKEFEKFVSFPAIK